MMTLDLGMGSCLPSIAGGTFSRKPSSWRDNTSGLPSYQLPAWVASRVPRCGMVKVGGAVRSSPSPSPSLSLSLSFPTSVRGVCLPEE